MTNMNSIAEGLWRSSGDKTILGRLTIKVAGTTLRALNVGDVLLLYDRAKNILV